MGEAGMKVSVAPAGARGGDHSDLRSAGRLARNSRMGECMYKKPKLEKFGTFRELTQLGLDADGDGGVYIGLIANNAPSADGCNLNQYTGGLFSCSR